MRARCARDARAAGCKNKHCAASVPPVGRAGQACAIQRGKALLATGAREEAAAVLEGAAARAASLELLVHEVTPPARCVCWARLRILRRWHVAKPRGAWSP